MAPPAPTLVSEALRDLGRMSTYTKRLGVLPPSFVHILAHALGTADPPPSLQYLGCLMATLRQALWAAAVLCFRAAHNARSWLLRSVAGCQVAAAEEALAAQRRYERRRAGPARSGRCGSVVCPPPVRVSARTRTRPNLPGFSVAWMGEFVELAEDVPRPPRDLFSSECLPSLCRLV